MRSYLADFNEISLVQREMDRAQAFDDLNHEIAGRDVGKISRFLGDNASDAISARKRGKDGADDALEFALAAQQSYEALLNDTWDRLRDAETAAEHALQQAQDDLAASTAALQTTLDRAATLPDGTRVFRDEAGQVWNEHGEAVDPAVADTIEWQGSEPSQETFTIREDAVSQDQQRVDTIRGHQVTLGEHRERMDEGDLSRDELEDIGESIDDMMFDISPSQAADMTETQPASLIGLALPDLGS